MNTQEIVKELKREIASIKREYGAGTVKAWDTLDVENMEANEAYTRGYYRACMASIEMLTRAHEYA